jgi:hypothetical protein
VNIETLGEIRAELDSDPNARGYAGMTDLEAAQDMNTAYVDAPLRKVTAAEYRDWASVNGRALNIVDGITSGANEDTKNTCYLWDLMLQAGQEGPNPANSIHVAQVDLLVAQSVLEASDKTALVNAATDQITRAQELGLPHIREGYVQRARALQVGT